MTKYGQEAIERLAVLKVARRRRVKVAVMTAMCTMVAAMPLGVILDATGVTDFGPLGWLLTAMAVAMPIGLFSGSLAGAEVMRRWRNELASAS